MGIDEYLRMAQVGMETAVLVSAPILAIGLVAGLAVSIFQAATQINDASLAFIPKIGATILALMIFGHFMITKLVTFTTWAYNHIPNLMP